MLKFRIEGQKLTWENPDEVVVAGTKKYLECYFEFDGDAWSGFEYVEAFFKNGRDKPIRMLLSANRIWKEDGLCLAAGDWSVYLCATTYNTEKEEIERQITSSSVSIRVLAHGQFEDAQNSFESPEIANQYIAAMQVYEEAREKAEDERVEAENARNVFEEYSSGKTYVKGNKVSYGGSSYVLVVDEVTGVSPDDSDAWLLIASKGDTGEKGKDAVLPAGNMRKRGDFSHLPNNVPVGEVIKVTETIYKDDTVLIPCKDGFGWYETDDDNISALDISKHTLLYEVMEALEGNILRGIVDGKTEITIEIIKYEDNLFYVRDLVEHSISALFGCTEKLEATVPFDSIRGVLEDYKKVLFEKGTYAISNGGSWESFSGEEFEKLKIENYHRDDKIYKIETELSDNDWGFAYNDLENVSNEDFKRKAEEAGVGGDDAGLADEPPCKGTVDKYTDLPTEATEGDIYYVSNYYTDFDVNNLAFDSYVTGTQYKMGDNFTTTFAREICELEGISAPTDISAICHTINIPYVVIAKVNKYFSAQKYFAIEIYKLMSHTMDDGEGGTDSEYLAYFEDKCNAEYLREFQDGIFVNYQALSISSGNRYYYTIIPKSDIHEYPKGAYIYNGSEWVHM